MRFAVCSLHVKRVKRGAWQVLVLHCRLLACRWGVPGGGVGRGDSVSNFRDTNNLKGERKSFSRIRRGLRVLGYN